MKWYIQRMAHAFNKFQSNIINTDYGTAGIEAETRGLFTSMSVVILAKFKYSGPTSREALAQPPLLSANRSNV